MTWTWRGRAATSLYGTLANFPVEQWHSKECTKALRESYPFGERAMWPYRVWLEERRRILHGANHIRKEDQPLLWRDP